jgi:two-component system, cell cycle sensor histidine kinase and response regulator CckA
MDDDPLKIPNNLRKRAESRIRRTPEEPVPATPEDTRALIHELRVHQIELEMQNDELRHIQRELEASRQRYAQLYHQAPVGYLMIDKDGVVTEANQTLAGLLDTTREKLCGRPLSDVIHPDDHGHYFGRYQAFFNQPNDKHMELRLMRSDQACFYGRLEGRSASVDASSANEPPQKNLLMIVHDVSDRKRWEDKLRKYKSMVTSASDFIALIDKHYTFQVINRSYAAAFKKKPEALIGRQVGDVYGWEVFENALKSFIDKSISGEDTQFKAWFDFPGLKRRFIDGACHPIFDDNGAVTGIVMIKRDTTRMKTLEDQLIQSQKMEAVGTLAGGIAHDFNNLLMGIQGRVSLMLHDLDDLHPHYEHLKHIETYINNASGLTGQLLGYARGGKYQVRTTDLNRLIQKQIEIFARTKKEITTKVDYDSRLPMVAVDRNQMQQVLLNLFVNAWQAMPEGGSLHIRTAYVRLDENFSQTYKVKRGGYVQLTVSDSGVGMDEKTRLRIFEPFFTTKAMGRGTGLGLASVYGIIKNHAGYIEVTSKPGQGTSFQIYLPATDAKDGATADGAATESGGRKRILVVDDEAMVLEVCRDMLEKLGYAVLAVDSGEKAVDLVSRNDKKIDLVLLDIIMPGLSGGETFDRLKSVKPDLKILLASGYSLDTKATAIMNRGCDGFIQKPYTLKNLTEKIQSILN